MSEESLKVKHLTPWELNPRVISPSDQRILYKTMTQYGDLGGITFNRRNGRLVTAHQRHTFFTSETPVEITQKFDPPTRTGTTAVGYVEHDGERYSYREVDWDETTHAAAAIASNKAGGDWDWQKLKDLMIDKFDPSAQFDMELTGWNEVEIENLFGDAWAGVKVEPGEEKRGANAEERVEEFLSADMRQVILWFGIQEFEQFNAWCKKLIEETGKETKTEALFEMLKRKYGPEPTAYGTTENLPA